MRRFSGPRKCLQAFKSEMLWWSFVLRRFVLEKSYSSYITTPRRFSADSLKACKAFLCKLMRTSVHLVSVL